MEEGRKITASVWVLIVGVLFAVLGIALFCGSESLAWERVASNVSEFDTRKMERIQFVGDRLSWLGIGLIVVGAFGAVSQSQRRG